MSNSEIKFRILVLMSTYNGEKYLREQLDSILAQKGVEVRLLIRDDGSNDSTCEILSEYSKQYNNIEWFSGNNIGFVKSFSYLVRYAINYKVQPDYYAFADQDDIWFSNKLAQSCRHLDSVSNDLPNLFTCNSIRIDENGEKIGLFHEGEKPNIEKGNVLIYGTEQGCSMVFNHKAAELFISREPSVSWHDRWLYLICFYLGNVIYDHSPLFFYRIHGKNALATHQVNNEKQKVWLSHFKELFSYLAPTPISNHLEMAKEFYYSFEESINNDDKRIIKQYITYRKNIISKYRVMFGKEYQCPYVSSYEEYPHRRFILFNKL